MNAFSLNNLILVSLAFFTSVLLTMVSAVGTQLTLLTLISL